MLQIFQIHLDYFFSTTLNNFTFANSGKKKTHLNPSINEALIKRGRSLATMTVS